MLGYAGRGTARVHVEAIVPDSVSSSAPVQPVRAATSNAAAIADQRQNIAANESRDFLQVAAFSSMEAARNLVARLSTFINFPVLIQSDPGQNGKVLHKVRIGPLPDNRAIEEIIDGVQSAGLGTPFKVRI